MGVQYLSQTWRTARLQETHLSWACQRHSGIEELVDTLTQAKNSTNNGDKVLLTTSQFEPLQTHHTPDNHLDNASEEEVILMTQSLILDEPRNDTINQPGSQQIFHTEHQTEENAAEFDIDHWTQIFYNSEAAMLETGEDQILTTSGEAALNHTSPTEQPGNQTLPTETAERKNGEEEEQITAGEAINNLQNYNNEIWGQQIFFQDSDFTDGSDIEDVVHSTVFSMTTPHTTQTIPGATKGISKELVKYLFLNVCAFSPTKCNPAVIQVLLLMLLVIPLTWGAGLSNQFNEIGKPTTQAQMFIPFHRATDIGNNVNTKKKQSTPHISLEPNNTPGPLTNQ